MTESKKKIKYLVADTTAFINAVQLNANKTSLRFALRSASTRATCRSVKHCVEFAKKTGDYASLSGIDIKVIALTYELEADYIGTSSQNRAGSRKNCSIKENLRNFKTPQSYPDVYIPEVTQEELGGTIRKLKFEGGDEEEANDVLVPEKQDNGSDSSEPEDDVDEIEKSTANNTDYHDNGA
ncbi:RNA-binding protein NOB1 [Eumeta japonica]|uniref:RNA-binding protein NOB1 n=1 Tax=Eumeta variegata TaxID=151549 RepID=A0A4C1TSI8_EUMVA|nr:RNA-binding protein NOB1 [Eumeta japonica]